MSATSSFAIRSGRRGDQTEDLFEDRGMKKHLDVRTRRQMLRPRIGEDRAAHRDDDVVAMTIEADEEATQGRTLVRCDPS